MTPDNFIKAVRENGGVVFFPDIGALNKAVRQMGYHKLDPLFPCVQYQGMQIYKYQGINLKPFPKLEEI